MTNKAALDWLNFLLADVKDGVGPFLAIYLLSTQHWDATDIGIAMTAAGIATVVARAPAGALIDVTPRKRGSIVAAAALVAAGVVVTAAWPNFWSVIAAQTVIGAADALFPPAVAAITLGIVGRQAFTQRIGRNETFNHAGNAAAAIAAGLAGYLLAPVAVLRLVAIGAAAGIVAALAIDPQAIDHAEARGADAKHPGGRGGLALLWHCRPLLIFTLSISLFHFANAAMLPLVGEKLALANKGTETLFMAACIIVAQIVMVPMALLVGHKADDWGRKPLFLAGFAVLPIRGVLYTLSDNAYYLVSIQILDGIGAGFFGALFFIVVADLTKGTGHYNLALGTAAAAWGIGGSPQQLGCRRDRRPGRLRRCFPVSGGGRPGRLCAVLGRRSGNARRRARPRHAAGMPVAEGR